MKKILLLSIPLVFSYTSYAQTQKEKEEILNRYDSNKIESAKTLIEEYSSKNKNSVKELIEAGIPKTIILKNGNRAVLRGVSDNNEPLYYTTHNADAAETTRTNFLHTGGALGLDLNGENMRIGVWDEGTVLKTHVEFQKNGETRVTTPNGASPEFHGTHVGGTMVAQGINAQAKGMAPEASLVSYDWDSDNTEVLTEVASNSLLISNHSYGVPVENSSASYMGTYSSESRAWDIIANAGAYYLMVASAGNDGSTSYTGGLKTGYDKLTGNKVSKNNLVVANSNDAFINPSTGSILIEPNMNSSSSQGPADDGRIKPDITGNGTGLTSTSNTGNSAYGSSSGTSMSSPNVAGSLLLLQQYYNELNSEFMRSSTLKGLACHTADDILNVGPDARAGWGMLNMKDAAEAITNAFDDSSTSGTYAIIEELSLSQGETYQITVSSDQIQNLEATICWIDPAGQVITATNSSTPALVNDLDLRIKQSGTEYFPWKLDLSDISDPAIKGDNTVDNVEKVEVDSPNANTYTIEVTHKGTLSGGSQFYSLIVTGISSTSLDVATNEVVSNVSVWPNPAQSYINITTENDFNLNDWNVNLYDLQGRTVVKNINTETVNIENLSSGIYILNFKNGNESFQKKIIKE